ncbi:MAG: hypothetical protein ABIP92_14825 [Arthrobacter sp.]|nr:MULTISPECIES: hypothetical protein [unclassified Arthrobacter]MCB5282703.1 hypothetical protein [Arthrobacter sp. ES1]WGZ79109.1 hypothetical protein QI450_14800 [Arthrobacter sp. EM1]
MPSTPDVTLNLEAPDAGFTKWLHSPSAAVTAALALRQREPGIPR